MLVSAKNFHPFWWYNVGILKTSIKNRFDTRYQAFFLAFLSIYIDFDKHFKDWLYRLIAYFGIRLENYTEEKSLYHLYRVHDLITHYKETGKFEYYFSKENFELAKDLKTSMNIEKHLPRLKEIFSYLLSVYEEEQE